MKAKHSNYREKIDTIEVYNIEMIHDVLISVTLQST